MYFSGGTTRCAWNRLRLLGDGHGRGRGGSLERGPVFRAEKLQKPGGENPNGVREPDATGPSQYRQIPSILDGYSQ